MSKQFLDEGGLSLYDSKIKEYITDEIRKKVPDAPTTQGTYTLQLTVSDGVKSFAWVSTQS